MAVRVQGPTTLADWYRQSQGADEKTKAQKGEMASAAGGCWNWAFPPGLYETQISSLSLSVSPPGFGEKDRSHS